MTTPTTVNVRLQLRADTAANWTAANPTLLANEVGLETDTKKLKVGDGTTAWGSLAYFPSIVSGGTVLGNLEIGSTGTLTFEGSTADGFETTLAVTDPTADRTITLPDQSGTVVVTGNASIVNADIAANAEIAVSKLANGAARQLLQTDAAGTGVEWTDNVDVPGTLDVTSDATFDANVTIEGDLTVNGTTTTIDTETLLVKDKNIELAVVDTPTDLTADGGGITLKGATDKTLTWSDTTDAWTSNQVLDVPAGSAAAPSLIFGADVNSGIYSPGADQVAISSNAVQRVNFGTGEVVFNDGGEDYDFRIEGDTEPNLVFIDASANRVGLGTSSPATDLHISNTTGPVFRIGASAGVGDDASTGRIEFYGGSTAGDGPGIKAVIDTESTSGTARDFDLLFKTSGNVGSGEPLERLRITASGNVGIGDNGPDSTLTVKAATGVTPFKVSGPSSEFAKIDTSGRLLVGTSTASSQAVAGSVSATQLILGGDASKRYAGTVGTVTATTGTTIFNFQNTGVNARAAYVKLKIAHRAANKTPSNSPCAEYAFQLFKDGTDATSLNGASTLFEYTYVRATHFAFADLGSGQCTITLTNPTGQSLVGSYEVEVLDGSSGWSLTSITTT